MAILLTVLFFIKTDVLDKELHFLSRQIKSDWKMHLDFCNKLKIVTRLEFNIFTDTCVQTNVLQNSLWNYPILIDWIIIWEPA